MKLLTSVLTEDMNTCIFTASPYVERHHIFSASNKKNSERYGFTAPLRFDLHPNGARVDRRYAEKIDTFLKKWCQQYYVNNYGSREEFIDTFGKSWLDENETVETIEEFAAELRSLLILGGQHE